MMQKHFIALLGMAGILVLSGCAGAKPYSFDVQPQEKLVIGDFSVNGDITMENFERLSPGILQKKEELYAHTQSSIDSAAEVFSAALQAALPDVGVVPLSELSANADWIKLTRPVERKLMGMTISEADTIVYADVVGLANLSAYRQVKADSMMTLAGADALLSLQFDANLEPGMVGNDVVKVEAALGPVSWLVVKTKVNATLFRKGQGVVWRGSYTLTGKENAMAVALMLPKDQYPRLFVSSLDELPAKLAAELEKSRNRPVEAAAK